MGIQRVIATALAAVVVGLGTLPAVGQNYQFVNIVDNSGPLFSFGEPTLNGGTAAFYARIEDVMGDGVFRDGIFTGSGGATTTIADNSGLFNVFGIGNEPSINAAGTVAFRGSFRTGVGGVFTGSGGATTAIALTGDQIVSFGFPSINADGTVSFLGLFDSAQLNRTGGIFTRNGTVTTSIADTTGPILRFDSETSINAGGVVAFSAFLEAGGTSLFSGSGGALTTIADTSGSLRFFASPSISDDGTVAFHAFLSDSTDALFAGSGGALTTIADRSGPFGGFGNVGINAGGTIAFRAFLTSGATGIFTGDDAVADKVIRRGDGLFGSTVDSVEFRGDGGINDFGDVAFQYTLATGANGVAVAVSSHRYIGPSGSFDDAANFAFGALPGDLLPTFITPDHAVIVTGPAAPKTLRSLTIGTTGTPASGIAELRLEPSGQLNINETLTVQTQGKLRIDGAATALGGVQNSGEIELVNNAQLNGGTLVNTGLLRGNGTVGNAVNNQGRIEAIGELRFTGPVTNAASTGLIVGQGATLRFDRGLANNGAMDISFGDSNVLGDINNTGAIQIGGGARATFHDDLIQNGTMQIAKAGDTTSAAVFLGSLSGAGGFTGGGDVFALGDLRPGNSPAVVTFDGNLFLGDSTTTEIEIAGTAPGQFDKLIVTGELALDGQLSIVPIDGFTLTFDQQFLIAEAGTLTGMFNGLGEGALVGTFGGTDLFITYAAGDGNDVQLFTIPEPASVCLLAMGGLLIVHRRPGLRRTSRRTVPCPTPPGMRPI